MGGIGKTWLLREAGTTIFDDIVGELPGEHQVAIKRIHRLRMVWHLHRVGRCQQEIIEFANNIVNCESTPGMGIASNDRFSGTALRRIS